MQYFFFYCFLGWIWETSYVSVKEKRFVNRGFLRGPLIPIYGSGVMVVVLATAPFQGNIPAEFFSGMIFASILEYCTGAAMEAIFKVRYWDYSTRKFNLNGHICLAASLLWGVFAVLVSEFLHPAVVGWFGKIPESALRIATNLVTVGFIIDFSLSLKAALDLRDVLVRMEAAKAEMARMQKRMDVIIALTNEDMRQMKEEYEKRQKEFADNLEQTKDALREKLENVPMPDLTQQYNEMRESFGQKMEEYRQMAADSAFAEIYAKYRDEVAELRTRFEMTEETRNTMSALRDRVVRSLVRSNPEMCSKKYKEALEEIKNKTLRRK
jgi:uncharacterized membrane protein